MRKGKENECYRGGKMSVLVEMREEWTEGKRECERGEESGWGEEFGWKERKWRKEGGGHLRGYE